MQSSVIDNPEPDEIIELDDGSLIQHGPYNDRIYVMRLGDNVVAENAFNLISMAEEYGYSKIFAKIPSCIVDDFVKAGFAVEATIPGFYDGVETGKFVGYFLDEEREVEPDSKNFAQIRRVSINKANASVGKLDTNHFRLRKCRMEDVPRIAKIYRSVFKSYPFPIHDPDYLVAAMHGDVDYYCIETKGKIVALASSEKDNDHANTEMTDFATLPKWRGNGLAVHLLRRMEHEARKQGIKTAYTIARAASPGMNVTFSKRGYALGGRLKNNTNISGNIESMNVWYKSLAVQPDL